VVLLVSDNPATGEPRRVRTGLDGAVELNLRPGNYTVESDRPVALGGEAYLWTEIIDVAAGRVTALALTATNAAIDKDAGGTSSSAAPLRADSAAIFNTWQRSIVEIWTPTAHATGFVIDRRGLVATNEKAIRDATSVHVQFAGRNTTPEPLKIPGRVIASDRLQGVAIIWIDPGSIASLPPVPLGCANTSGPAVKYNDRIVTIITPMLEPKNAVAGSVGRIESQAFQVDWRLGRGNAGGPVFAADGTAIGITVDEDERDRERRGDAYVIPISHACGPLASAEKAMAGGVPPLATSLRVEAALPANPRRTIADPKTPSTSLGARPRAQAPVITSSDFEMAFLTPLMARDDPSMSNPRADFGNWMDYVANAPPVLLVRVTPQFEESFWKMLARGAAQTQGMALPALKSFNANFLRMRAFCGSVEVVPIQPFIINRQISERAAIREGLYVFALTDFGPQCATVRFDLYSEKAPDKADSRTIDPTLFAQIGGVSSGVRQ
ncbi:MAG: S1 family peptidase, partial [Vicinamibacterales bacterium]